MTILGNASILAAAVLPRWITAWLAAFVATQAFELPIHAMALDWSWRTPAAASPSVASVRARDPLATTWSWPSSRAWATALVPSSITHPVVWFVFPRLVPADWMTMVVAAEAFAVLGEALILRLLAPRLGVVGALAVSLVANAASLGLGLWLRATTGWV